MNQIEESTTEQKRGRGRPKKDVRAIDDKNYFNRYYHEKVKIPFNCSRCDKIVNKHFINRHYNSFKCQFIFSEKNKSLEINEL